MKDEPSLLRKDMDALVSKLAFRWACMLVVFVAVVTMLRKVL